MLPSKIKKENFKQPALEEIYGHIMFIVIIYIGILFLESEFLQEKK